MYLYAPTDISSCLFKSDALMLLEFTHRSLLCNSEDDFTDLFQQIQKILPFDFALAMLGCVDNEDIIIPHCVNISFPEEWLSEYRSKNYIKIDALVKHNFRAYEIQDLSDTTKKKLCEPKEITSLCKDFRMNRGYIHGSRPLLNGNNGSMFCFSSASMKYSIRTEAILHYITPHLHLALSNVFRKIQTGNVKVDLSSREKEVLDWLKQGKSSWDISVILGIRERTVNFHVCNLLQKLGASNRTQAVAVAAHLGIITID